MRIDKPILLVEDDRVDVMTVQRALKEIGMTNRLEIAGDGEEALAFLRNPKNEGPCVILLDVNMPRMNGIEFLREVKQDQALKSIPVVMLTTSADEQDKFESFELGVAGYIIKPVDFDQFIGVVRAIDLYWTLSEFPNGG